MKLFQLFKKKEKAPVQWASHIRFSVRHPLLFGYYTTVLDGTRHRKKLRSMEEVAQFICSQGIESGNLLITTEDNTPFISTFGMYVDRIEDKSYRDKLFSILLPMQDKADNDALDAAVGKAIP